MKKNVTISMDIEDYMWLSSQPEGISMIIRKALSEYKELKEQVTRLQTVIDELTYRLHNEQDKNTPV